MIPVFWLEPAVSVFATFVVALVTGGSPGLAVSDDGLHYLVRYDRD